ncbi:MAG: penicillin-binding protein 1A [Commensalibacter sp.]
MSSVPPDSHVPPDRKHTQPVRRLRYRFWRIFLGIIAGLLLLIFVGGGIVVWLQYARLTKDMPTVEGLRSYEPPVMSRIYANNDQVIAELASERRLFVPSSAIPDRVKNAFIAAEDQKFYSHGGIDPMAITRAIVTDMTMRRGHRPVGASTITQQVARIMLLNSNELSMKRKVREAILAMRIEQTLSKDQIIEIYLNEIYLGVGSYGVASAAQAYFNKPLDKLTDAEAALLASLPRSPVNYNPFRYPKAAIARRNWVLQRMATNHFITQEAADIATKESLVPQGYVRQGPLAGSEWFGEEVRRQLVERYGADKTMQGGLEVHTSLDTKTQNLATRLMRQALMKYDRNRGWRGPVKHIAYNDMMLWQEQIAKEKAPSGILSNWRYALVLSQSGNVGWLEGGAKGQPHTGTINAKDMAWARRTHPLKAGDLVMIEPLAENGQVNLQQIPLVEGALVSMDVKTGRVLAMFGGWSFAESQFNRATQALRQPGSSFKPVVYLAAMENGISPSQKFMDSPFSSGNWHPSNYEKDFQGPTTLHDGLRQSRNLVTIRVAAQVGMKAVANLAIALQEVPSMPLVLPAALGAVETTVLRHAGVYASIANGGVVVNPTLIDYIQDRHGHVIWRPEDMSVEQPQNLNEMPVIKDNRKRVVSEQSAFQVVTMLEDVIKRGTGHLAGKGIDRPLAGKTGTSQDFNDAWFAGFSPDVVTIVWFGYDQRKSLGKNMTGAVVAGPVWNSFMKEVLAERPKLDFIPPTGISLASYDTGRGVAVDAFKEGQIPGVSVSLEGGAANGELTAADTGAENIPDSEEDMGGSNLSHEQGNSEGPSRSNPEVGGGQPSSGGDIGMGGLY